jgi:hypothetical protein
MQAVASFPQSPTNDSLFPSKSLFEGCLYRRRADASTVSGKSNIWSYHNHIIHGPYLRYIIRPLNSKDAASYRLVLVQGKSEGRLKHILIHPKSEISLTTLNEAEAPPGYCFVINVSGIAVDGTNEFWQLALQTVTAQLEWRDALLAARLSHEQMEESGEGERLRTLARKMMCEIDIRNRFRNFKFHSKCFLGSVAVKWLTGELNCTSSQAVTMGNR